MDLDRSFGDSQSPADLLVGQALRDQPQHLELASTEALACRRRCRWQQRPRDSSVQRGVPQRSRPDGGEHIACVAVLEEVANSTGRQCVSHPFLVSKGRQHHDVDLWVPLQDSSGRLDPPDARHGQVHQDHVRQQVAGHGDRLLTALRITDDL